MTDTHTPTPEQLDLGEILAELKKRDPTQHVPIGFGEPHSYRGYYEQLAFKPAANTTVGDMLAAAELALGSTYQGWKGGDYFMDEHTLCWLVQDEGYSGGETIGGVLLHLMLEAT